MTFCSCGIILPTLKMGRNDSTGETKCQQAFMAKHFSFKPDSNQQPMDYENASTHKHTNAHLHTCISGTYAISLMLDGTMWRPSVYDGSVRVTVGGGDFCEVDTTVGECVEEEEEEGME